MSQQDGAVGCAESRLVHLQHGAPTKWCLQCPAVGPPCAWLMVEGVVVLGVLPGGSGDGVSDKDGAALPRGAGFSFLGRSAGRKDGPCGLIVRN